MYKKIFVVIVMVMSMTACGNEKISKAYMNPQKTVEERITEIIGLMTIDEKVGQMVQGERAAVTPDDVKRYYLGAVLSGGGSVPGNNTINDWNTMYDRYQQKALETRLGIPLIYGIDAVHGNNNVAGAVIFPHNIGLGSARDGKLMEKIGDVTIKEVLATGPNWNFAPCVAVSLDERWGRSYESYGEKAELQELLAGEYVKGIQGEFGTEYLAEGKGVATAKHFVGDGAAKYGTGVEGLVDRGNCNTSDAEMESMLAGYVKAMDNGVLSVMASFSSVDGIKMHENRKLLTERLKGKMGFKGFLVSDWEAVVQISGDSYEDKAIKSINAGVDMIMEPNRWRDTIKAIKNGITAKKITADRADDAVKRILYAKLKSGLFGRPFADKKLKEEFGSDKHREIAREAVRKSLVLLKNKEGILPLKKGKKVYVTGPALDDIGIQCGGWTLTWQGEADNGRGKYKGTSILQGLIDMGRESGVEIITDEKEAVKADIVMAVIGEKPYAEMMGDSNNLGLDGKTALEGNMETLNRAYKLGKPVVTVIVAGRPMIISDSVDKWDAAVMAWLPGSEGRGVAEVLMGKYDFQGKLSVSWPREMGQIPVNSGDKNYNPLYEYGYGLSYK